MSFGRISVSVLFLGLVVCLSAPARKPATDGEAASKLLNRSVQERKTKKELKDLEAGKKRPIPKEVEEATGVPPMPGR